MNKSTPGWVAIKRNKMKTLGLIGGTSWHSTIEYYRNINQAVNDHFGNNTNPPLLIFNQNQALIHQLQIEDNWSAIASLFIDAAKRLQKSGASALLFCANTPHKIFEEVESQISIPIIHIVDATSNTILQEGLKKVCFIGTRFSMEENFLLNRFLKNGVNVAVPKDQNEIKELHRIIQEELTFGNIDMNSKRFVIRSIETMVTEGAEGVVLGCTEFPLMIKENDLNIPIFNTTKIHSQSAIQYVLSDESNKRSSEKQ